MSKIHISQEQIMEILDKCYSMTIKGIPGSPSCTDLANEYLDKYTNPKLAAKKMIDTQITKCTTSGFVTSLGGIITLPVALPANIVSVMYIQIRMIATLAVLGGYDPSTDEVQTMTYVCLVNTSIADLCKSTGVQFGNKFTMAMLKKLPGSVLTKINQKVGFRLFTKFGEKGLINLSKMVPVAGGFVGGGLDFISTKRIANKAYRTFILNEID